MILSHASTVLRCFSTSLSTEFGVLSHTLLKTKQNNKKQKQKRCKNAIWKSKQTSKRQNKTNDQTAKWNKEPTKTPLSSFCAGQLLLCRRHTLECSWCTQRHSIGNTGFPLPAGYQVQTTLGRVGLEAHCPSQYSQPRANEQQPLNW